jgi:hypothetical protein
MDTNKIFKLFESDNPEENSSPKENQRLVDIFKDHPIVKISYFKKLVKNYSIHAEELAKFFHKGNQELDIKDIKAAGEFILFTRAWQNISEIDINNPFHLECLLSLANDDLFFAFDFSIKHFEKLEEYERCGFIKSLKEKVFSLK